MSIIPDFSCLEVSKTFSTHHQSPHKKTRDQEASSSSSHLLRTLQASFQIFYFVSSKQLRISGHFRSHHYPVFYWDEQRKLSLSLFLALFPLIMPLCPKWCPTQLTSLPIFIPGYLYSRRKIRKWKPVWVHSSALFPWGLVCPPPQLGVLSRYNF